ncbi:hypothetical protein [Planococcus maritimus]|uniref:hypothetical protein n=1 Tax=Planococcus maritimus TaxID=192421 RepID=UPI00079B5FC9|nr:hypothetical protein [Planococcus maritimus]KYG59476.1 hypothetical protein AY633_04325 [Planococcus maritimus]
MNKKILVTVVTLMVFVVLVGGTVMFLKSNPPLETNSLAYTESGHAVTVGFGNQGWGDFQLTEVAVNNFEEPLERKIQLSNPLKGFVVTDDFESAEAQAYDFTDLDEVTIKTGTSPTGLLEKVNNGTASEDDEAYALTVKHDKKIHTVHIKYSYFGITLYEQVEVSSS